MESRAGFNRGARFETRAIHTIEQLASLRPEWQSLWAETRGTTPFQAPDWLIPWCRHFAKEICGIALFCRNRLVGLIPWVTIAHQEAAARALVFAGVGLSDYLDGTFAAGFERASVEAGLRWLHERGWSVCDLAGLPATSPFLSARPPQSWTMQTAIQDVCPVLQLPRSPEELGGVIPARQLEKLRYYRARARRDCGMKIESANEKNFADLFHLFIELHGRRWAEHGERGVLADPPVKQFDFEAAGAFVRDNILRLYILHLGADRAAALYVFMHQRRAYYYLAGFDPRFKVFSPGMLLIGHAIEQAILEGAVEFDFLRGHEAYKYAWGAVDRRTFSLRLLRACNDGDSTDVGPE